MNQAQGKMFKLKKNVHMDVSFQRIAEILSTSPAEYQADFLNALFYEMLLVTKSKEGLINQIREIEKRLDELSLMSVAGILKSYEERSK